MTEGEPCYFTVAFFDLIADPVDGEVEGEAILPGPGSGGIEEGFGSL